MEFDDKRLKELMLESKLEMPFSDFEDNMMARIEAFEIQKVKANRSKFYAILSFFVGTIFGLILNFLLSRDLSWVSSSVDVQDKFYLVSQIAYVVLIVLFSDKLWKLWKFKNIPIKGSN